MMKAGPVLCLSRQQAQQLATHCRAYRAYRAYLWQCLPPSSERNQALRGIQALQGQLEQFREQTQPNLTLFLSEEGKSTLRQLFFILMKHYGTEQPSAQRNQMLGELASLRLLVERTCRQTQVLEGAKREER
jgi:hypothetical protein